MKPIASCKPTNTLAYVPQVKPLNHVMKKKYLASGTYNHVFAERRKEEIHLSLRINQKAKEKVATQNFEDSIRRNYEILGIVSNLRIKNRSYILF